MVYDRRIGFTPANSAENTNLAGSLNEVGERQIVHAGCQLKPGLIKSLRLLQLHNRRGHIGRLDIAGRFLQIRL